jgi:5-methylcytosine-specific restriction endonuclease McrA
LGATGPETVFEGGRTRKAIARAMYHPELIRHPDSCPALVLNADYTPLSYYPLSLWPWQTAVKAMFLERVDVVAHYEREVHSPSRALKLPSVIALRQFVKPNEYPAFTRFNLFLRDRFRCVYCGSGRELTFDHVVPRAQGGRTTWENVATACAPCNLRKGGRTPAQAKMHFEREPIRPTSWQLQDHGKSFPPNYLHQSWRDYLYWDVELEP